MRRKSSFSEKLVAMCLGCLLIKFALGLDALHSYMLELGIMSLAYFVHREFDNW
jgi:uncharacterized membrane-anchored protein YitT (DUF2179 family)